MPLTGSGRVANPPPPINQPQVAAPGCQSCREQHLKCDRVTPVCGRCAANGRQCRRGYKFKAIKAGSFSRNQKWVCSPTKVTYVDETNATAQNYEARGGRIGLGADDEDDDHEGEAPGGPTPAAISVAEASSVTLEERSPIQTASLSRYPPALGSPTDRFIMHEENSGGHKTSREADRPTYPSVYDGYTALPLYLARPVWPLKHEEAFLFRHFVQNLAAWLDLCDPYTSFQTIVPQRAGTCPTLLNAIFALAARHLSNTTHNYDHLASNRYHQMCLLTLIPMLKKATDDASNISDENLFAATIILRVLEEMEVRNLGVDTRGHLLGIHAFVHGDNREIAPQSLTAAAFWVGLRQEIYSAVMNHQPVRINLGLPIVDRSLSVPAEDHVWANRAITHCADVLNFCFCRDSAPPDPQRWAELSNWSRGWQEALPTSYVPLYQGDAQDSPFPEIWYQTSCQVIGVQHNILAELFLTIFDPKAPTAGGQWKPKPVNVDNRRVESLLRQLCGIGLYNQWSPPALFTACMGVSAFGDRFDSKADQEAFLDILTRTEREHARPTESVQKQMMKAWGWIADDG